MKNELILDEFGNFFEDHGLYNFDEELFFSMLSCPSNIIQQFAVKRFIESGIDFDVTIQKLYPLGDNDFEIIRDNNYMRNLEFKKTHLDPKLEEDDEMVKVQYFTSSFSIDLRLRSNFSDQLLEVMSKADEEILMSNLRFILREIWNKNILFSWSYAIINWLATILFFIATVFYQNNFWYMLFSCIFFFILLFFELVVASKDLKRYFKSKYNFVDLFQYVFMPLIMWLNFLNIFEDKTQWYNAVVSTTMLIAAGRALTMLRVLDGVRYLVAMILHVFIDMKAFMFILMGSIFSFALIELEVLKTVDPAEGEEKPKFYTLTHYFVAFDAMYNVAYGGWEGSNEYNMNQYFHFLVNTIFLPLIMLNLLIAIISKTFEDFEEKKEVSDIKETIDMLQDFNYFIRKFYGSSKIRWEKGLMLFRKNKPNNSIEDDEKIYVHLIKKSEVEEVDVSEKLEEFQSNLEDIKEEFKEELKESENEILNILQESQIHIMKNAEQNKKNLEVLLRTGLGLEKEGENDVMKEIEKVKQKTNNFHQLITNIRNGVKQYNGVIDDFKKKFKLNSSGSEYSEEGEGESEEGESDGEQEG